MSHAIFDKSLMETRTHLFQIILSTNIAESSITVSDVKYGQFTSSFYLYFVLLLQYLSPESGLVGFV